MGIGFTIWVALCWIITVVWLKRHIDLTVALRGDYALHSGSELPSPATWPKVSVVVAAKDEEHAIAGCVRSLSEQDYPNFDMTVANDRSADRTGEVLESLKEEFPERLRVKTIEKLPAGWMGKSHAVHTAVSDADGDYLLFTDADCRQLSDRTISIAVQYAEANDIDMLSIIPRVEPSGLAEAIIMPVCTGILMLWHQPERVNDPDRPECYANGAFIMFRRDAYDRMGGHESVREALNEDMALAQRAKACGVRLHVIQNKDLYETRMYGPFGATWRGWCRLFLGCMMTPRKLIRALLVVLMSTVMPAASLVLSMLMIALSSEEASGHWVQLAMASGAVMVGLHTVMLRFYGIMGAPVYRAFTYVPAAAISAGILFHALLKCFGFGSTVWRGTVYQAADTSGNAVHVNG